MRDNEESASEARKRLDYIRSLQDTVGMNWRKMTEEEVALQGKVCGRNHLVAAVLLPPV